MMYGYGASLLIRTPQARLWEQSELLCSSVILLYFGLNLIDINQSMWVNYNCSRVLIESPLMTKLSAHLFFRVILSLVFPEPFFYTL